MNCVCPDYDGYNQFVVPPFSAAVDVSSVVSDWLKLAYVTFESGRSRYCRTLAKRRSASGCVASASGDAPAFSPDAGTNSVRVIENRKSEPVRYGSRLRPIRQTGVTQQYGADFTFGRRTLAFTSDGLDVAGGIK